MALIFAFVISKPTAQSETRASAYLLNVPCAGVKTNEVAVPDTSDWAARVRAAVLNLFCLLIFAEEMSSEMYTIGKYQTTDPWFWLPPVQRGFYQSRSYPYL